MSVASRVSDVDDAAWLMNKWWRYARLFLVIMGLFIAPSASLALNNVPIPWLRALCESPCMRTQVSMTQDELETALTQCEEANFKPVWLDGYNVGNRVLYNAIFERDDNGRQIAFHQSLEEFREQVAALEASNDRRFAHVDMYTGPNGLLFAWILEPYDPSTDEAWSLSGPEELDEDRFARQLESRRDSGSQLRNFSIAERDSRFFVIALYYRTTAGDWQAGVGLNLMAIQEEDRVQREAGRHLRYLNGYDDNGEARLNAIWDEPLGDELEVAFDLSVDEFIRRVAEAMGAGERTRVVTGFSQGASERLGGLWTR